MKNSLLFIIIILVSYLNLNAQNDPLKWGKVDPSDLSMSVYSEDSEADAIILADYGSLRFDFSTNDVNSILERHVRIKILRKSAFDRGNIEIPFYSKDRKEKISNLKAQLILPNGKEVEVDSKDIFDEEINEYWSRKKFAFSGMEEGCILEYKYTKKSSLIYYLDEWIFQSDIPTRYSEFKTSIPDWYDYVIFNQGIKCGTESSRSSQTISFSTQVSNRTGSLGASSNFKMNDVSTTFLDERYFLENIPALKKESFITTMTDYYSKLSFQLKSIKYPNSALVKTTSTWAERAKELEDNPRFGDQMNRQRYIAELIKDIEPHLKNIKEDQMQVDFMLNFINEKVKWNNIYGFYSNSLDEVYKKNSAKSGEINLMFIALCREFGIESFPVLLSTRSNGKMLEEYPKTDQFNHLIAYYKIGEDQKIVDIGNPYKSTSILNEFSLNHKGWLVDGENSQWINISPQSDVDVTLINVKMDLDGTLQGTVSKSLTGYCAQEARENLVIDKPQNYKFFKNEWQTKFPEAQLTDINFENELKVNEALKCKMNINIPQGAKVNGDFMYFSPLMGQGLNENPFKQKERSFQVDIPYPSIEQVILNISIPEGYSIEGIPDQVKIKLDESGAAIFQYLVTPSANSIQIIYKFIINKLQYEPEEYQVLKSFFDTVVEKSAEQIVLKKS